VKNREKVKNRGRSFLLKVQIEKRGSKKIKRKVLLRCSLPTENRREVKNIGKFWFTTLSKLPLFFTGRKLRPLCMDRSHCRLRPPKTAARQIAGPCRTAYLSGSRMNNRYSSELPDKYSVPSRNELVKECHFGLLLVSYQSRNRTVVCEHYGL